MNKSIVTFAFAALSSLSLTQSAAAQMNPRFDGWLGCWRLEDDLAGTGARLCITPEKEGVVLQTLAGTVKGIDEVVIADGVARPIVDSECKGTERAEWSRDGQRLFRTTEVTCKNETPRTIKGVAFLAPGPTWINVQHVSGQGAAPNLRVQRYRRAANQNLANGTRAAQPQTPATIPDAAWSIEDVIEASEKLPAEALQGALADVRQKFAINRRTLVAMDEAGVPDTVIDLMVALTFPQRFIVERRTSSAPVGVTTGMGWYDPFMSPFMTPAYSNCFTTAGRYYGYRSYYDLCGMYNYAYNYYPYNYYGLHDYYYGGTGGWVTTNPGPDAPTTSTGRGRVVNGQGYTQIRERTPEPSAPRTSSRGDGSASGWSGASSGGGGVSSGGYSSGSSSGASSGGGSSSSGGGDRTAVPRPPGGD
jgi:hypothetical protein